jgi:isoquinoline 1-oxidoreductase beta subunit
MTAHDTRISRRLLLKGTTGLVIAFHLPFSGRKAVAAAQTLIPNAFVRIGTDDLVTVLIKHIEMGQGPFTGLATLVAEELDADWDQMRAEHAPSNTDLYKNLAFGLQGTGGSTAIANSYEQMRKAGAVARAMLVQAAAQSWGVVASEITIDHGVLRHAGTGKHGRFGEFASAAAALVPPDPEKVPLKDPSQFRLIGNDGGAVRRLDTAAKSTGTAKYAIDISEPGMLTVVVRHPSLFGAKVKSFDAADAMAVEGVADVKAISKGVAVYANGTWPALKGREALKVEWDETGCEKRGSEEILEQYRKLAETAGALAAEHGDAAGTLAEAERVIESEYVFPYLAHAPMEPLDGVMLWDGKKAKGRFGSQLQSVDHMTIAGILGIEPQNVEIETMLAGGSFGRRGEYDSGLTIELAEVAKAIGPGRPVKLMWTREDDIRGGRYRPFFLHRMQGAVRDGKIVAWTNRIVGQSFLAGTAFESFVFKDGVDATMVEGSRALPYAIPNFHCDVHITDVAIPTLSWRSVGHTHTGYAVECFIDELLEAAGQDPVEGRLAMMENSPRHARVLQAAADLANWSGPGPVNGRARGVAVVESFHTFVAHIAEVSAGSGDGPRVHKVWTAVDCGVAVNPDIIRAQMEGGVGYGLGHALFAEISLTGGRPDQHNFDSYRSLRINEMPEVDVTIIRSDEKPTGVGEPGVPPIAPAVANAMARLGLGRPRRLPIVRGMV